MTWPTIRSDWRAQPALDVHGQMVYAETIFWHPSGDKPPLDQDVLITFEGTRGAYIGAWMGSENGWVGVDALPVDRVAWWAVIPPGPPPAMTAAASGLAPEPAR